MAVDYFYSIPNPILLFIFIVVLVSIALIGLYIFTILVADGSSNSFSKRFSDQNTGTYLSTVAVAVALIIAFIISDEWQTYSELSAAAVEEANAIYLVATTMRSLPDTEQIIEFIIYYLCSIINSEFPDMADGILPGDNDYLNSLQALIYEYEPVSSHDEILYGKAVDLFNQAIFLRNQRLGASTASIPNEFWWILIIGFIIIVVLTWFINGDNLYRILMTSFVTIIYASLLFVIVVLNYPYRGNFRITPEPYQFVLDKLFPDFDCSTIPMDPFIIPINFSTLKQTYAKICNKKCNKNIK